jgi:hypothetical protein
MPQGLAAVIVQGDTPEVSSPLLCPPLAFGPWRHRSEFRLLYIE